MEIKDTSNDIQTNPVSPDLKKKKNFKKKNFNGHLRNNKNSHNHQHYTKNDNLPKDDEPDSITQSTPQPIYNELFYILRQKYNHNTKEFFVQLEKTLLEIDFHLIQSNGMSLFSYAVLYEKNDIFSNLIEKYSDKIQREDFEKHIIPTSLNKNVELLSLAIKVFNSNFVLESIFINELSVVMSKTSYRETNNKIILDWVGNKLSPEQIDEFWTYCIENKNLSLIDSILKYDKFNKYLKNNFNHFVPMLEKIGKKNEIERKIINFNIEASITHQEVVQEILQTEKEIKTYLSNSDEQLKNLNNDTAPNIIVKKKKKVIV